MDFLKNALPICCIQRDSPWIQDIKRLEVKGQGKIIHENSKGELGWLYYCQTKLVLSQKGHETRSVYINKRFSSRRNNNCKHTCSQNIWSKNWHNWRELETNTSLLVMARRKTDGRSLRIEGLNHLQPERPRESIQNTASRRHLTGDMGHSPRHTIY